MMMIIAPTSRAHKGKKERGEVKGEYGGVCGEEEENTYYGGMVQPSQQHVAPCVKVVGCLRIWHERLENVKLPGKFNHASLFLLSLLYFHLSNFSGSFCCICVYICLLSSLLYVFVIFAQLFQISIIQTNWVKS